MHHDAGQGWSEGRIVGSSTRVRHASSTSSKLPRGSFCPPRCSMHTMNDRSRTRQLHPRHLALFTSVLLILVTVALLQSRARPSADLSPWDGPAPPGPSPDVPRPTPAGDARAPRRFVGEPSAAVYLPDPWSIVSMALHAKNLGPSSGAGVDVQQDALRVDTGRYSFDLPWSELLFAYTLDDDGPAPTLCLMPVDDRPICLGNVRLDSAGEVATTVNRKANGIQVSR